jgi:hypothetical protein
MSGTLTPRGGILVQGEGRIPYSNVIRAEPGERLSVEKLLTRPWGDCVGHVHSHGKFLASATLMRIQAGKCRSAGLVLTNAVTMSTLCSYVTPSGVQ